VVAAWLVVVRDFLAIVVNIVTIIAKILAIIQREAATLQHRRIDLSIWPEWREIEVEGSLGKGGAGRRRWWWWWWRRSDPCQRVAFIRPSTSRTSTDSL
jgi:hypothetical protein